MGPAREVKRADQIVWHVWTRESLGPHRPLPGSFRVPRTSDARSVQRFAYDNAQLEQASIQVAIRIAFAHAHAHAEIDLATR